MQSDNRFFDDMARVAGSALNTLTGLKNEVETMIRQQFERFTADMNLVTRDEFDAVQAMAANARAENERLADRLVQLEAELAALKESKGSGRKKNAGEKGEDAGV